MRGWRPLDALLVFVPAAAVVDVVGTSASALFAVSAVAVIPLASLIGRSTEALTERIGGTAGALLNATFGNATELVVGIFLIAHADVAILKASITGAIVGNLLLVLGAAIVAGGLRRQEQELNKHAADMHATMLVVAVATYIIPSIYSLRSEASKDRIADLSYGLAAVLIVLYVAAMVFMLITHRSLFRSALDEKPAPTAQMWSPRYAALVLAASAVAVAVVSDFVANSVKSAGPDLGLTTGFLGFVIVPIVGNAAEHYSAVLMAARDRIDVAADIAIGSSMQLIMFVVPVFVLAGVVSGHRVTLAFGGLELAILAASSLLVRQVISDARVHWLEGSQLLGLYAVFAVAAYYTSVH